MIWVSFRWNQVWISWWLTLTIAPIYIHVSGIRLGSLIIWRNDKQFADDDLILVEIASTVVGIQMLNYQREEDEKRIFVVGQRWIWLSIPCLTLNCGLFLPSLVNWKEMRTVDCFYHCRSDWYHRSVIVNALRKLESAGIIESRSLGMKEPISKCWFQISLRN